MITSITSGDFQRCVLVVGLLLTAVAFATQTALAQNVKSSPEYTELANAPVKAVDRHHPLESDPEAVRAGAKLYSLHCSECHGSTAEGARKGPSLRAEEVQTSTPGTLFWLLTNGVVWHGMPVWSKLPEPQRWQLVTYIKSLGSAGPGKANDDKSAHP